VIKILIAFLFCQMAWGKVSLELKTQQATVNQGEIIEGVLILKEGVVPPFSLRDKTFGKTVYLFSLEPFVGRASTFEAKAKVIFVKVPETNILLETVNGEEVVISWSGLKVKPTEAVQSFLFGDFEIPARKKVLPWIGGILTLAFLCFIGWFLLSKSNRKRLQKQKKKMLKDQLSQADNYENVVTIWKNKHQTLKEFPEMDNAFKNLEATLFKYQFKPHRTPDEIQQVMDAYAKFRDEILKGQNGV
jgi:hypothetical protein